MTQKWVVFQRHKLKYRLKWLLVFFSSTVLQYTKYIVRYAQIHTYFLKPTVTAQGKTLKGQRNLCFIHILGPVLSCPVKEFDHDLCVYDLDYIKVLLYKSITLYEEKDESPRHIRAIGMSENLGGGQVVMQWA